MSVGGLAFSVLASGSGGNCTAIRLEERDGRRRLALVDLGLSPRMTRGRLGQVGWAWREVTDVLLTHLDSDHFRPTWAAQLQGSAVRVHASEEHCRGLRAMGVCPHRLTAIGGGGAGGLGRLDPDVNVQAMALPHDEGWTTGWILEREGLRLGYATDLGTAPEALLEAFVDLDAVLLESNYDPALQLASRRPDFLKRRIMGGRGHLSNEQALEAMLAISARCGRLRHIALLHLSRQCNDPAIVRRLWRERAPHLEDRLILTSQHVASPIVRVGAPASLGDLLPLFAAAEPA